LTSGSPNFALSAATTMSQDSAISQPPASAYPSTAAISGLAGGASVRPANPRPGMDGRPPVRNAFRSIPAQNVPPAPVITPTRRSSRPSSASMAAATPAATSALTALRASGRLMVITRTPSASPV
jgi:hypothetical protein